MTKTTKQLYAYKSIDNKSVLCDCTPNQINFPPSKLIGIKADFVADVASKTGKTQLTAQEAINLVAEAGFNALNEQYKANTDLTLDMKDHSFSRSVALNTRNVGNNPAIIEQWKQLQAKAEVKADTSKTKDVIAEAQAYINTFKTAISTAMEAGRVITPEALKAQIEAQPKSVRSALYAQFLPPLKTPSVEVSS